MSELNLDNIDFGSFKKEDDELQKQESLSQRAKANYNFAADQNPDEHAKNIQLAQEAEMPVDLVKSNPAEVSKNLDMKKINFDEMSRKNPNTVEFITDFDNAVIARDDITLMQEIENKFSEMFRFSDNIGRENSLNFQKMNEGFWMYGTSKLPERRQDIIPFDALPPGVMGPQEAQIISEEFAANFGINTDEEFKAAKEESMNEAISRVRDINAEIERITPKDMNVVETGIRSGITSLFQMAPAVAVSLVSGGRAAPGLAVMYGEVFTGSYADAREKGLSADEASTYANLQAGVEVATEMIPAKSLVNMLGMKKEVSNLTQEAMKFAITEFLGEQVNTGAQTLIDVAYGLDEEMKNATSVEEIMQIQLRRQAVTAIATVFAGGSQMAITSTISKAVEKINAADLNSDQLQESEQRTIDEINELSAQSKLRERNPDKFRQFIEQNADENHSHVYFDPVQTRMYLKSVPTNNADPGLDLLNESIQQSDYGAEIAIPVGEFATYIAGTEHFDALREHITMTTEGVSLFRQEQVKQENAQYVQRLVAQAEENATNYIEAQEIFNEVRDQLVDSGVYSSENASVMAEIVPAWATVFAAERGISVAEAYNQTGLVIQGPQTGVREDLTSQLERFKQYSKEELDFFKEQGVLEGETPEEIENFQPAKDKVKAKVNTLLTEGSLTPEDSFRGASLEELRAIVNTGELQVGRDLEGRPGISAALLGDGQFPVYGDGVGYIVKSGNYTDSGRAGEVLVNENLKPEDLEYVIGEEVFSYEELKQKLSEGESFKQRAKKQFITEEFGGTKPAKPTSFEDPTETEEFKKWSEGGEVVESYRVNDYKFKPNTPVILKVFHGTTHEFTEFDATRANIESHFGKMSYFTSDNYDATQNYGGEGPDLTVRINERKEELIDDIQEKFDEQGREEVLQELYEETGRLRFVSAKIADMDDIDAVIATAEELARYELHGGEEKVLELYVKVKNPFVVGAGYEPNGSIEFFDSDIEAEVLENVALDNNITIEELKENRDEYQDNIDEERWLLMDQKGNQIAEAIQTVANRYDADPSNILYQLMDYGDSISNNDLESLMRSDDYINSTYEEYEGKNAGTQIVSEVIEELGFDSIILKNANERFNSMAMDRNTAHIHLFDSGKKNIKSVENEGTFSTETANIYKQEERGYYSPSESLIRLTEAADLSTFLHEFAHFMYEQELITGGNKVKNISAWLERNADAVAKEATSYLEEGSVEPLDIKIYNLKRTTGDELKDKAIRQAEHEQFARGFEQYLMEGKSPSIELTNVFRKFARWLTQIYSKIRNALKVNMDDDMRAVFDRFIATEEQIQMAISRKKYEPLFTDAAMAGMTDQQFEKYKEQQEKTSDKESETLREKLMRAVRNRTQKWWNEEKADLIVEQTEVLKKRPIYRAVQALKGEKIKLDHATVKEMVGIDKTDKRGVQSRRIPYKLQGMTKTGALGIHPDEAAAIFGFNGGHEMLTEIMNAPTLKEAADYQAEQIMIQRHGDILNDGTIEMEADRAIQSEERGELLLSELRVLSRQMNVEYMKKQAIKSLAEENISKLTFRNINPAKYRKAEVRAAQEAATAVAEGKIEEAQAAKTRQIVNYYLGMYATKAKEETIKIADRMSRYNKKSVQQEIQKSEGGYWDQIVKILERFEFRKHATLKSVDQKNQDINSWAKDRIENFGDGLVLSPEVLNETYLTHWKNVPFKALKGISDSVKNIEHVARYGNKMRRMGEEIDFKTLVQNWVDKMNEQPSRFKSERTTTTEGKNFGRWAMGQMTKIPWMASWLDGGERVGLSHQILVQPMNDAYDVELKLWKSVGNDVIKALENRSKADLKRHNRKIFIKEIKDQNNDGNLYGHQILAVALNVGNESNLRKMLLGEGWAFEDKPDTISIDNVKLQAVLKHMTKSDWELVQLVWDKMNELYPQLAEVHRRTTGLTPPKVESTPVETEFGTFKGGYYPVKYDPNRSNRAEVNQEKQEAQVESMFGSIGSIQSSVNAGATNERTGFYDTIDLNLDVIPNHFSEVIHYITHHDAIREVNKLIRNNQVRDTIKEKLGVEEYKQLRPWLNDIAKDGRGMPAKTFIDAMLQKLRFGVTLGVMGFKASTGIIQVSGLSNSIAEVGSKKMFQSMRKILSNPTKSIPEAWEFAKANSKVLEHRTQTMDREIKAAMDRIQGKRGILAAVQEASMKHIMYVQTFAVDLPSWYAAYLKAMEEHGDEKRAFQYGDWVVENVQGSGAIKDLPQIMRNQNEATRMFTMFMTFFSSLWNNQRDLVKGARSGAYSKTTVAAKLMFLITIPVIFESMLRGDLGPKEGEEPEDALERFLVKMGTFPLQAIPFIRDIVNGSVGTYGYNISPIGQLIEQGTQSIPEVVERGFTDEEITEAQAKGASKFAGAVLGIPGTSQAWATGEHLYDVAVQGEELTLRQLLFGPEKK